MKVDRKQLITYLRLKSRKHPLQLRHFVFIMLSLFVFLTGCATTGVRLPSAQDKEAIQLKDKTIVLLRLKVEKDGEPVNLLERHGDLYAIDRFSLNIANMDEEEYPRVIYTYPSLEAREEGWRYQVLKPGTYYLSLFPPGSNLPTEIYRFHVSKGESIMYVGSLSVSCMGKQKFFGPWISECPEINVTDERELAQKIAQASFSQYGSLSTSLMQQYDKLVTPFTIEELVPMGVMTKDTDIFTTPDLMKRAIGQGLDTALWIDDDPRVVLLLLPSGLVTGTIKGFVDKGIYQPCMQELELEVRKLDKAEILRKTINKTLPKYGISQLVELDGGDNICENIAKNGLKSILLVKILRIELIEDDTWGKKYFVGVTIRIQLKKVTTNTRLYDRVFLYTNPNRIISYGYKTYEFPLYETSESRKLKIYCEQEGFKILKEEITKAIQFSVERFCNDLGLEL
jgi:hypothetical protein